MNVSQADRQSAAGVSMVSEAYLDVKAATEGLAALATSVAEPDAVSQGKGAARLRANASLTTQLISAPRPESFVHIAHVPHALQVSEPGSPTSAGDELGNAEMEQFAFGIASSPGVAGGTEGGWRVGPSPAFTPRASDIPISTELATGTVVDRERNVGLSYKLAANTVSQTFKQSRHPRALSSAIEMKKTN
jgi:hypothetical protein